MAKSARRGQKVVSSATASSSPSGSSTPSSRSSTGPIPPFARAPAALEPFLEPLSPREVYLIHIDNSTKSLKTQAFQVPVIFNIVIVLIIAFRAYKGLSTYPALVAMLFGYKSSMTVDTSILSWEELTRIVLSRTATFLIDYLLVTLFLAWPIRFVRGPVRWRRAVGFRDREIVVRRSQPSWSRELVKNTWIRDDDEAMRDRIVAAVTPERISKTGYLLVDADWDLDYDAMIRAHAMVDGARKGAGVPLEEFRTAVLVHTDSDGWLIWRVGDEETAEGRARSAQREHILAFRDKLVKLGKEDLFYRWVELVQFESSQPDGFTADRQQSAMVQVQEMFRNEKLDFETLWKEAGGREALPELD